MFWWNMCIFYFFFQMSFLMHSLNKSNLSGKTALQIPSQLLKPPKSPSFYWPFQDFYGDPCGSTMLTSSDHSTLSLWAHQSDKSISFPFPAQVSPATASNECPFNLHLIAEWHFPFVLLPSSYPLIYLEIQLAQIGAQYLTLHNDVN